MIEIFLIDIILDVIIEKIGHITTIGINRPEKRNCVDFNTATQIKDAIEQFEEDNNSSAAVLYGTGGNFCSGFDLNELASLEANSELENLVENGLMVSYRWLHIMSIFLFFFREYLPNS